jgi:uncharacterized protein (DUF488 family)
MTTLAYTHEGQSVEPTHTVVYTIGHSNTPAEQLLALLRAHEISVLVDVRSAPYSQWTPQFNREALSTTLEGQGVEYRFAGHYLGGRPREAQYYKHGDLPDEHANFLELVDYRKIARSEWFLKGLHHLIGLARERRTAIMCTEENPMQCHRHHLVAQALIDQGVEVVHIRGSGEQEIARAEPEQMSLLDLG